MMVVALDRALMRPFSVCERHSRTKHLHAEAIKRLNLIMLMWAEAACMRELWAGKDWQYLVLHG